MRQEPQLHPIDVMSVRVQRLEHPAGRHIHIDLGERQRHEVNQQDGRNVWFQQGFKAAPQQRKKRLSVLEKHP